MGTSKVAAWGEILWDRFPDADRLGGAPANFACHAQLLGAEVHFITRVGADTLGCRLRKRYGPEYALDGFQQFARRDLG